MALPADHPDRMRPRLSARTREVPFVKLAWTHKLAIDLMIEHPEWTEKELAGYFGHTPSWVSMVVNSDAFQAKLAERRDEVLNPEVKASIEERFKVLAKNSLERLNSKLENPNASDNLVLRSVELAAKALGLGVRPPPPVSPVQIAIIIPPKREVQE